MGVSGRGINGSAALRPLAAVATRALSLLKPARGGECGEPGFFPGLCFPGLHQSDGVLGWEPRLNEVVRYWDRERLRVLFPPHEGDSSARGMGSVVVRAPVCEDDGVRSTSDLLQDRTGLAVLEDPEPPVQGGFYWLVQVH